jgi:hypothetical protein
MNDETITAAALAEGMTLLKPPNMRTCTLGSVGRTRHYGGGKRCAGGMQFNSSFATGNSRQRWLHPARLGPGFHHRLALSTERGRHGRCGNRPLLFHRKGTLNTRTSAVRSRLQRPVRYKQETSANRISGIAIGQSVSL